MAGPIWEEGPTTGGSGGSKDAGALVETSGPVSAPSAGASGGTLTKINGKTSSGLVGSDSVDMFTIRVNSPSTFHVHTIGTTWDTVLFLFKQVVLSDGSVVAQPVAMNDDTFLGAAVVYQSRLQNVQTTGCTSGDCWSIPDLTIGTYYLAVGKYQALPVERSRSGTSPLFTYSQTSTATVLPTAGQSTKRLNDWTGASPGGDYSITIVGGVVVSSSNSCESAPVLGEGIHAFGAASTSDVAENNLGYANLCGSSGVLDTIADPVWFRVAPANGTLTIGVCPTSGTGVTPYNFVVFEGGCGALTPVACGDLACATGAAVQIPVSQCDDLFVAFGPWITAGSASWAPRTGSILISVAETPVCPPDPDTNGDGVVDGKDLAAILSNWTTE